MTRSVLLPLKHPPCGEMMEFFSIAELHLLFDPGLYVPTVAVLSWSTSAISRLYGHARLASAHPIREQPNDRPLFRRV